MEWLNHNAGFKGFGMSRTGSNHCRQYMVSEVLVHQIQMASPKEQVGWCSQWDCQTPQQMHGIKTFRLSCKACKKSTDVWRHNVSSVVKLIQDLLPTPYFQHFFFNHAADRHVSVTFVNTTQKHLKTCPTQPNSSDVCNVAWQLTLLLLCKNSHPT